MEETTLKELGFKHANRVSYSDYHKVYKTKLGKFILSIDPQEKIKSEQLCVLFTPNVKNWEGDFDMKYSSATDKNIRKWDNYLNKIKEI